MSSNRNNTFDDRCNVGAIQTAVIKLSQIVSKKANADATVSGTFISFENFQIPSDKSILFSYIGCFANMKNSMSFGFADNTTGTNFVKLFDSSIMIPVKDLLLEYEFIFTIPIGKFPIILTTAPIILGECVIQGIEYTFQQLPLSTYNSIGFSL